MPIAETPVEETSTQAIAEMKPLIILVEENQPSPLSLQLISDIQLGPSSVPTSTTAINAGTTVTNLSQLVADLTLPPTEPVPTPRRYAFLDPNHPSGQITNFSNGPLSDRNSVTVAGFNHSDDNPIFYPDIIIHQATDDETKCQGAAYPTLFD